MNTTETTNGTTVENGVRFTLPNLYLLSLDTVRDEPAGLGETIEHYPVLIFAAF